MATTTKAKPNLEGWEVKGFKTYRGHDGYGFNANLYYKGKKVAEVDDDGWGGGYRYYWLSKEAEKLMENFVAALPPLKDEDTVKLFPDGLAYNMDMAIEEFLIRPIEEEKEWRKQCRKGLIVRCKSLGPDSFYVHKCAINQANIDKAKAKYGDDLIEIVNERFMK